MKRRRHSSLARLFIVVALAAACGGGRKQGSSTPIAVPRPETAADRMLALLPTGVQLVIEVDVARLRANSVVGPLVTKVVAPGGIDRLAGFADADQVVFAAYGLGTAQAATVILMTAKQPLEGTTKIGDGIYATGPTEWVAQVESRAAIERSSPLNAPKDLLELRDRAMPPKATGAALRVTAKLSFDARVALARISGIESAPAALSVWADVADDFGIIVDADSTDPGEKKPDKALARMKGIVTAAIGQLARDPTVVALGLPSALEQAKVVTRGSWVRAIIAIGPRHLERVVERAGTLLEP